MENFKKSDIEKVHGDVEFYRNLYEGKHSQIFERAKNLVEKGEITDRIQYGEARAKNIRTPYIVANVSKVIVDIPTLFISRSLGELKTNYPTSLEEQGEESEEVGTTHLEMTEDMFDNPFDLQQDTLDQITDNSNLSRQHSMNIKQWQIDGGLVLVPEIINGQAKISFKSRNVYYELDDGRTFQLRYLKEIDDEEYVHIHQEVEHEKKVVVTHKAYRVKNDDELVELDEVNDAELIYEITNIEPEYRYMEYIGRKRKLFEYLPYNPTFMNPLGISALDGLDGKQDEVNWTITRAAQTFERNGKPRISVSRGIMQELQRISLERYGTEGNFDHRDLEVTEIDEEGNSLVIHQIDVSKIGDITYVKDIIRMMMMETQTSEQAIDFLQSSGSTSSQSGVAKFYDMLISIMKAEHLREQYVSFIRRGVESCLWLLERDNKDIKVEKPNIPQKEIIPVTSKEVAEENIMKYQGKAQSLEQTVRNMNPEHSEEWIMNEVESIEADSVSTDSMSLIRGNMSALNFNDNKPIENEEATDSDTQIVE